MKCGQTSKKLSCSSSISVFTVAALKGHKLHTKSLCDYWEIRQCDPCNAPVCDDSVCSLLFLFDSSFHIWTKSTVSRLKKKKQPHKCLISAVSSFQWSNRAITFTFLLLPLTLANLQSQWKLKSLKDSTVISGAFEGEWGGKIIIHGFICERDGSLMYSRQKSLRSWGGTGSFSWRCSAP